MTKFVISLASVRGQKECATNAKVVSSSTVSLFTFFVCTSGRQRLAKVTLVFLRLGNEPLECHTQLDSHTCTVVLQPPSIDYAIGKHFDWQR